MADPIPLNPGRSGGGGSRSSDASSGGPGGGGGIPVSMINAYIDAKMESAETRLTASLDDKFRRFDERLSGLPQSSTMWKMVGTLIFGLFSAVGAIFGILSWTGDRVDGATSTMTSVAEKQAAIGVNDERQNQRLNEIESAIKADRNKDHTP